VPVLIIGKGMGVLLLVKLGVPGAYVVVAGSLLPPQLAKNILDIKINVEAHNILENMKLNLFIKPLKLLNYLKSS